MAQEDPSENPFTDSLSFFEERFTVFPGRVEGSIFILNLVLKALFAGWSVPESDDFVAFRKRASRLLHAVLALNDAVAARAGLETGIVSEELFKGPVYSLLTVPTEATLQQLRHAIAFSEQELRSLLKARGISSEALEPLIIGAEEARQVVDVTDYHVHYAPLLSRPIVRFPDATLALVFPTSFLDAAVAHVRAFAREAGVAELFEDRLREAVEATASRSMLTLGWAFQGTSEPDTDDQDDQHVAPHAYRFGFDRDKEACLLPVLCPESRVTVASTGPSQTHAADVPVTRWRAEQVANRLAESIAQLETSAALGEIAPNDILFVVVCQSLGLLSSLDVISLEEEILASLKQQSDGVVGHVLVLTAEDLDVITILEAGDPLGLWKFALARANLRHKAVVCSTGILEEYFACRNGRHHFLVPLSPPRNKEGYACAFLPGYSVRLRSEARKLDRRMVAGFGGIAAIEVVRLHWHGSDPLYVPFGPAFGFPAVYVDGLPTPVWVIGDEATTSVPRGPSDMADMVPALFNLTRMVAYWFWQFTPVLAEMLDVWPKRRSPLVVTVSFDEDFFEERIDAEAVAGEEPLTVSANPATGGIGIVLRPAFQRLLQCSDNVGERHLLRELLAAFVGLLPQTVVDRFPAERQTEWVDQYAPLGLKRIMLHFNPMESAVLDGRDLLPMRGVQKADEVGVLHEMGRYFLLEMGQSPGPVLADRHTTILRDAVSHLYERLERLVARLSPEDLLDCLIAQHEALCNAQFQHEITVATQITCFGADAEQVLGEELRAMHTASIACRFLIEYVAARPPSGLRPFSLSVYDELMALAAVLVEHGNYDDIRHHRLAEVDITLEKAGVLRVEGAAYSQARATQRPSFRAEQVRYATAAFRRASEWHDEESGSDASAAEDETAKMKAVNAACLSEWSVTLTDILEFYRLLADISEETDPVVVCLPEEHLKEAAKERLGWSPEKMGLALSRMVLTPRADFLKPPAPFNRNTDVLPWHFNRRLSYLQRPVLRRPGREGTSSELLWGVRNLHRSLNFLLEMLYEGRLRAESAGMKQFLGKLNSKKGLAFNAEVATKLSNRPSWTVRQEVEKVRAGNATISPPGDIDVLAADSISGRLYVIECKSLASARNPHETATEMGALYQDNAEAASAIRQAKRKAEWVTRNVEAVALWCGLPPSPTWTVIPLVVVDHVMLSPYLKHLGMPVICTDELECDANSWFATHTIGGQ